MIRNVSFDKCIVRVYISQSIAEYVVNVKGDFWQYGARGHALVIPVRCIETSSRRRA